MFHNKDEAYLKTLMTDEEYKKLKAKAQYSPMFILFMLVATVLVILGLFGGFE